MAKRRVGGEVQGDLFSVDPSGLLAHRLDALQWPAQARFPVNRASARVRNEVWGDRLASESPTIVAGYSSIAELVGFVAAWSGAQRVGPLRVVVGREPFESARKSFISARAAFTREVEECWLERGISRRLSALVVVALDAVRAGQVGVRAVHGASPLHAKVYVGGGAATTGSSNFTTNGLGAQVEVNARFERATEPDRYGELVSIAENLWSVGTDWRAEFTSLLERLLRVVTWRGWGPISSPPSVDRLWATGRVRRDLTALVCPPSVADTWRQEAVGCGLSINTISHGQAEPFERRRGPARAAYRPPGPAARS